MTDIFREVEDDYRQELLLDFWKRHAAAIIAALILILMGAVVFAFYQNWQTRIKEQQTTALSVALVTAQEKPADEGIAALTDVIGKTTGHQRIAARLALARVEAQKGDTVAALATYAAVANDGSANKAETGLARIAALELQIDTVDPATLAPELAALADDKSPWRFSAPRDAGAAGDPAGQPRRSAPDFHGARA